MLTTDSGRPEIGLDAHAGRGRRSVRDLAAAIALGLLFFMVTKGPVYRVRLDAAPLSGDFIDDRWIQTAFVAVAVLVALLSSPSASRLVRDRAVVGSYTALLATVLLSTIWSIDRSRTIEQGLMMAIGTAAALLAGAYLRRLDTLIALWAAMQLGVIVSVFAHFRDWSLATDINGDFAGIYFNRNSLGPVAVLAAATSGMIAGLLVRSRHLPGALLLFIVVGVDLAVWWKTGSLTPAGSVLAAGAIVLVFALLLQGAGAARRRIGIAACVVGTIAVLAALASWTRIARGLGRSTTLSGRTVIWDVVIDFVGQRPVQGWGFMAIWTEQPILEALALRGGAVYEAHSGYLEVLLGAGLLGIVALLAAIGVTIWRAACSFWRCPDLLGLYALVLSAFVLIVNLGETYVGANLLPWILLAVVAGQVSTGKSTSTAPRRDRTRTDVSRG